MTKTGEIRIGELSREHLPEIVSLHVQSFARSATTRLGLEAVRRYYEWQFIGPHQAHYLGAWLDAQLGGFCFCGKFRGALGGFLARNKWFLARQVLMRPWLLVYSEIRSAVVTAMRSLGRGGNCPTFAFMGRGHLQNPDVNGSHEPVRIPLNRPPGTFSPTGGEGRDEGVRFIGSPHELCPRESMKILPDTPSPHPPLPEEERVPAGRGSSDACSLSREDEVHEKSPMPSAVPPAHSQPRFGILAIAVAPRCRGLGLGARLMDEVEKIATQRGFREMGLTVHPSNGPAIRFYEKLGWERIRENGTWRGRMAKRLPEATESVCL